ncbi:hypothetical protein Nepgr_028310 [Nepenthes gracilis]|uniref:Uncharacterized protein n=1 Tax=Nepenthes gracilis TaxID=150966 RepID=A0AAD3TBQ8_NEPGR|nr:hypothetical protein Nepgr_028310 [Nepenthes gracilis]
MPEVRKLLACGDSVVGCVDAQCYVVSLKGSAARLHFNSCRQFCNCLVVRVGFLCSTDACLGMILMQMGAGLECCLCMKWLVPLLLLEPYAGVHWTAAVWLAWRWKGRFTGPCLMGSPDYAAAAVFWFAGTGAEGYCCSLLLFGLGVHLDCG